MAFETFNLGDVLSTAENIKAARRQSKLDELREISTRQQVDLQGQQAKQAQAQFSEKQRADNTKWLADATDRLLSLPEDQQAENAPIVFQEGQRRGMFAQGEMPAFNPEGVRKLNQEAKLALGGADPQSPEGKRAADIKSGLLSPDQIPGDQPNSVREFQFAKQNGFGGSFQEWIAAGGQSSRPSSVMEWEFFSKLPDEQKRIYLEMKRNPNMQVKDVGMVPTVIAPSNLGTQTTALSSLPQEAEAASTLAGATAGGKARGESQATAQIDLPQARADAQYMTKLLGDLKTHPGLPAAVGVKGPTNYLPGTPAADFKALHAQVRGRQFLEAFESLKGGGQITEIEGAKAEQAIARMDTAQSEKAFIAAATEFEGIIGNALKRAETKARASGPQAPQTQQQTPAQITSDAEFDALPSGTVFLAPDGTQRRKP